MARQALGTYDPTEVDVIFNGIIVETMAGHDLNHLAQLKRLAG